MPKKKAKKASKNAFMPKASVRKKKPAIVKDDMAGPSLADQESVHRQREHARRHNTTKRATGRDIGMFDMESINWGRRLYCKQSLKEFCETYLPRIFYLGWSSDQLEVIKDIETCFLKSGEMFALAMPRGGGKTALCRAGIVWGTAYGFKRFPFFVGSNAPKAEQTLEAIKAYWRGSPLLQQDFPEIGWSVKCLEGRSQLAAGQSFLGEPTHIMWLTSEIRYPCLILPKEIGEVYRDKDPHSVKWLEERQAYISKNAGITIRTAGIDSAIRGEAETHPVTLEQPRPDIVLLDDVQKDQKAESVTAVDKLIRLIDGAISGLAGPDRRISVLKPCTIIKPNDIAHTYLYKKPLYKGQVHKMVEHWPQGITDHAMNPDTEAGKLWMDYMFLRNKSLKKYKDNRLADEFYKDHRQQMDDGFICSWEERYDNTIELSPQQAAMNLRTDYPLTFAAEFQNNPQTEGLDGTFAMITADELVHKVTSHSRLTVPMEMPNCVCFIDVQNEVMFWGIVASDLNYTSQVIAYGTWPEIKHPMFTKHSTQSWSMLTSAYLQAHPDQRSKAYVTKQGFLRAELEPKLYYALTQTVQYILSLPLQFANGAKVELQRIGIDVRWGEANSVCKQFCANSGFSNLMACYGQSVPPSNIQIQNYQRRPGWVFEDQVCKNEKNSKWVIKPDTLGRVMMIDPDMMKDFTHTRLITPLGAKGCLSLHNASPDDHQLFAHHLCNSELPEEKEHRGVRKNQWMTMETQDNDWLDVVCGCMALLGTTGCSLQPDTEKDTEPRKPRPKLSTLYAQKRAQLGA